MEVIGYTCNLGAMLAITLWIIERSCIYPSAQGQAKKHCNYVEDKGRGGEDWGQGKVEHFTF